MADDRDRDFWGKLVAWGEIAVGAAFVFRGIAKVKSPHPGSELLGRSRLGESVAPRSTKPLPPGVIQLPQNAAVTRARVETVGDILDRVKRIKTLAVKDSIDPVVREEVVGLLTKKCGEKWCVAEKDSMGEISAMFWALRDPKSPLALRYTKDHIYVDQFSSARVMRKLKAEDCDGGTTRLAAWLMATGYPVVLRVVAARGSPTWSHIYILTGIPPGKPTQWVALDWSVTTFKPGDEAPGAKESARTGRPAGVIERVKDIPITADDFKGVVGTKHGKAE